MSKFPTSPSNLKQPSPDNQGLDKAKPADVNQQAAEVNRDIPVLEKKPAQKPLKPTTQSKK